MSERQYGVDALAHLDQWSANLSISPMLNLETISRWFISNFPINEAGVADLTHILGQIIILCFDDMKHICGDGTIWRLYLLGVLLVSLSMVGSGCVVG